MVRDLRTGWAPIPQQAQTTKGSSLASPPDRLRRRKQRYSRLSRILHSCVADISFKLLSPSLWFILIRDWRWIGEIWRLVLLHNILNQCFWGFGAFAVVGSSIAPDDIFKDWSPAILTDKISAISVVCSASVHFSFSFVGVSGSVARIMVCVFELFLHVSGFGGGWIISPVPLHFSHSTRMGPVGSSKQIDIIPS